MRVLHLSWEYPPLLYGGLGRHVQGLAEAQARAGHDVVVLTQQVAGAAPDARSAGVRVLRVPYPSPTAPGTDLFAWVAGFGRVLAAAASRLSDHWTPQLLHAHDWVVAPAVDRLRPAFAVPLVVTIHATEAGRHQGWLPDERSRALHATEGRLAWQANRVIACSEHMRWELTRLFALEPARVAVVPNGIDLRRWRRDPMGAAAARAQHAGAGPLLVCGARLEYEKGVQTVLAAMPRLRRRFPGLRLVVAGRGGYDAELRARARKLRLGTSVRFAGWLEATELRALVAAADAAVVPSIYEPFGFAALEAMALGTPVVAAATGGLAELVVDGRTGTTFPAQDEAGLAAAVGAVLVDENQARRLARSARARLRSAHDWVAVAERTTVVYNEAQRSSRPPAHAQPPPPPDGNLLRP